MKVVFTRRGVFALAIALCGVSAAACSEQPALTPDAPGAQYENSVLVGPNTPSSTTASGDSVGRGPGTVGSGH
jgi:hypothetical protein